MPEALAAARNCRIDCEEIPCDSGLARENPDKWGRSSPKIFPKTAGTPKPTIPVPVVLINCLRLMSNEHGYCRKLRRNRDFRIGRKGCFHFFVIFNKLPLRSDPVPVIALYLILSTFAIPAVAQITCIPVFVSEYKGTGSIQVHAVRSLPDGTFLVAGQGIQGMATTYDGYISKHNADGTPIWEYLIGGTDDDNFSGITLLSDGGALLYGSTKSFGHPEEKAWLARIDAGGTVLWSGQGGSAPTGTNRLKYIMLSPDGDIIGTLNINDSSATSDPIVFKLGLDGTLRWAHRFDNGGDDSFTSLAISGDTLFAGGYYSAGGTKHAVITELRIADGSTLNSRNIYRGDPSNQGEIAGLEIYNNTVSYGLYINQDASPSGGANGIVLIQTDLAGGRIQASFAKEADGSFLKAIRSKDSGFYVLRTDNGASGAPALNKINRSGTFGFGLALAPGSINSNFQAFDTTPDGGCITVGQYDANSRDIIRMVKVTARGESGSCNLSQQIMDVGTDGYQERPFTWATEPPVDKPDGAVETPATVTAPLTKVSSCTGSVSATIIPAIDLGPDTVVCRDASVILHAVSGYATYLWSDNSTAADLQVSLPGKYYITATDQCGNINSDTVLVTDASAGFHLTGDTVRCNKEVVPLQATNGYSNYQWSPAYNLRAQGNQAWVTPNVSTRYTVTAERRPGCTVGDSLLVTALTSPDIHFGGDTSLCMGDSLLLDGPPSFDSYQWSTGETTQQIAVHTPGTYSLSAVYHNGCTSRDTIQLISLFDPQPQLNKDPALCTGTTRILDPGDQFAGYLWNDGSTGNTLQITAPGDYWVKVTDQHGCVAYDSIRIHQQACPLGFHVPHAFTPNADGHNDLFKPIVYGNIKSLYFAVYGRWGEKIFETQIPNQGWDGTVHGAPAPAGVYVWYCRYQLEGQPAGSDKGTVVLVR